VPVLCLVLCFTEASSFCFCPGRHLRLPVSRPRFACRASKEGLGRLRGGGAPRTRMAKVEDATEMVRLSELLSTCVEACLLGMEEIRKVQSSRAAGLKSPFSPRLTIFPHSGACSVNSKVAAPSSWRVFFSWRHLPIRIIPQGQLSLNSSRRCLDRLSEKDCR
jgi:hypothetical protein